MKIEQPVCILMAALGGQGGGVLVDWLVAAARIDRLQAQATSIPGVAQRTGATTYYFEICAKPGLDRRPVFSIFPASGAVDLMVSFEPMEAARALSNGYITKNTTVITASERIYSTFEKIKPGDGVSPLGPVLDALEELSGTLNIVDMSKAARQAKCHPNAVMFGAMAACGILPIKTESCRLAIRQSGVAVEQNLGGFEAGYNLKYDAHGPAGEPQAKYNEPPAQFALAIEELPKQVQAMAGHGVAHLTDYQNHTYARLYLERLTEIIVLDDKKHGHDLSQQVARRLAQWMAFEDIIRVAQLKTRPGRFERIRQELGVGADQPFYVHDYLKPGIDELRGILPGPIARLLPEPKHGAQSRGLPLKIKTSSPLGWMMMRGLASLKFWRPRSKRYSDENSMITRWLEAVKHAAAQDYQLARKLTDTAVWARGYGETRGRGFSQLRELLENSEQRISTDKTLFGQAIDVSLEKAYSVSENEPGQAAQ